MGELNYLWKTNVILDSKASRPTGKTLDLIGLRILDGLIPIGRRWNVGLWKDWQASLESERLRRSIMMAYEANGWIQCKGHLPWEKQICDAMDYFLLPVDEDRIDTEKQWELGMVQPNPFKIRTRKHEALVTRILRNSVDTGQTLLYIGRNRV